MQRRKVEHRPVRPIPYAVERDFADVAYAPHTITAGVLLISGAFLGCYLLLQAGVSSLRVGAIAAGLIFTVFGIVHLPDGLMIRPHPSVWRATLAVTLLYLGFISFMIFQDTATTRWIFGLYDPSLLVEPPQQSYANDCQFSTPEQPFKFMATVMDEFILAHCVGYWVKTLVLRDWRIVTLLSVLFEVIEIGAQHYMPNFRECWWDHIIIDVFICNAGGTLLGFLTLWLFKAKHFNWVKLSDIPSMKGKAKRMLGQLVPRDGIDRFQWHMFDSAKRFVQVLFIIAVMSLQETNTFSLKFMLNMKPSYHLVLGRLAIYGFAALPALREYYEFITDPGVKRLGTRAWVLAAVIIIETAWIIKMAYVGGFFRNDTPLNVAVPFLYALSAFLLWCVLFFSTPRRLRISRRVGCRVWLLCLDVLYYSAFASLLAMCAMTAPDLEWGKEAFNAAAQQVLDTPFPLPWAA